jgi:hypothetical protein
MCRPIGQASRDERMQMINLGCHAVRGFRMRQRSPIAPVKRLGIEVNECWWQPLDMYCNVCTFRRSLGRERRGPQLSVRPASTFRPLPIPAARWEPYKRSARIAVANGGNWPCTARRDQPRGSYQSWCLAAAEPTELHVAAPTSRRWRDGQRNQADRRTPPASNIERRQPSTRLLPR